MASAIRVGNVVVVDRSRLNWIVDQLLGKARLATTFVVGAFTARIIAAPAIASIWSNSLRATSGHHDCSLPAI